MQVGRQQAGLGAEPGGGVLLAEGGVAVRLGVVGADLVAQDRLLLAWTEVPAGGLGGTDPGRAPAMWPLVVARVSSGAGTASALSMAAMAVRSAETASGSRAFMALVRSRRRVSRSACGPVSGVTAGTPGGQEVKDDARRVPASEGPVLAV